MSRPRNGESEYPSLDAVDQQFDSDIAENQRMFDDQMNEADDPNIHWGQRSRNGDNYGAFDDGEDY